MTTILIADDNAQNLYLTRFLLEKEGCEVHEAHNGAEAVAAVSERDYDLVLMDIQMPVMDGLEATRIIKSRNNPPLVIALTARAMSGDRDSILSDGCDGYIEKPLSPEKFAEQIREYLVSA